MKAIVNTDALEAKAAALADRVIHLRDEVTGRQTATFDVPSSSQPHLSYVVDARHAPRLDGWRLWGCSCTWALSGGSECCHVRAVRQRWEAEAHVDEKPNGGPRVRGEYREET